MSHVTCHMSHVTCHMLASYWQLCLLLRSSSSLSNVSSLHSGAQHAQQRRGESPIISHLNTFTNWTRFRPGIMGFWVRCQVNGAILTQDNFLFLVVPASLIDRQLIYKLTKKWIFINMTTLIWFDAWTIAIKHKLQRRYSSSHFELCRNMMFYFTDRLIECLI